MKTLRMLPAWIFPVATASLFLIVQGCATAGSVMEAYGNATGETTLANAGKSFQRQAETQDFTEDEKYYTGRSVGANLLASEEPSDNKALETYVGKVGQTLALASGKATLPHGWHFMLLKGSDPDAFACPGGLIFITEGLVKTCDNEDELAGVLAHEISHVAIDHPMQAISASNRNAALVNLAQFAYNQASSGNQSAQALASNFGDVVKDVSQGVAHGYDRDKEKQADLNAVQMLAETGYDPRGLAKVLRKMKKTDNSHGDPLQRAGDVDHAVAALSSVPSVLAVRTERFKKALGRD